MTASQILQAAIEHHRAGRLIEAESLYQQILVLSPQHADALHLLGLVAHQTGRSHLGVDLINQAIAQNPRVASYYSNLGAAQRQCGRFDESIAACENALRLQPNLVEAHNNLGLALEAIGSFDRATEAYRTAIHLRPNHVDSLNNLAGALRKQGQLDEAIAAGRKAIAIQPQAPQPYSGLLYCLYFHPAQDAQSIYREHRQWNQLQAEPLKTLIRPHANDRSPQRRLKIGYVSPDFRNHPVGRFVLPLFSSHDHQRFEIFAYSSGTRSDAVTERLRPLTSQWRDIARLTDDEAAEQIRADSIDILVDLTLHTAFNRLLVFARKPAPVQVSYLGYPGTTGLDTIDYRLTDPYLDPPGCDESCYSERSFRLPQTYWCYPPPDLDLPVAPLPAMTDAQNAITFGSLNTLAKVNRSTLSLWARLLKQVPDSRLILHAHEGGHRQNTRDLLASAGVDPARVTFVPWQSFADYFCKYNQIDIGLDPFPYAGGTTTCDALWMGVPVVTLSGQTAVARGGHSVLMNARLPNLIARSEQQYLDIAIALASDLRALAELRATLRQRMLASPLMDARRSTTGIEQAYLQMWLAAATHQE